MKALFSTKYLAGMLNKALKDPSFNEIEFRSKEWILRRTGKVHLILKVEPINNIHRDELKVLKIDRIQWFQLMNFLEHIPEQPIVLQIFYYGNNDINIRLSEFVADF